MRVFQVQRGLPYAAIHPHLIRLLGQKEQDLRSVVPTMLGFRVRHGMLQKCVTTT